MLQILLRLTAKHMQLHASCYLSQKLRTLRFRQKKKESWGSQTIVCKFLNFLLDTSAKIIKKIGQNDLQQLLESVEPDSICNNILIAVRNPESSLRKVGYL